jgi:two-component system sensor histidine kinase SenX3
MDPAWLVLVSIAFGVVLGAGVVLIVTIAARRGRQAAEVVSPSVPDGVDQVIDALESGGVVLDPSNNVIKSSPGALALGLIWDNALVQPELLAIVDEVRRYGDPIVRELELPRGRIGEANIFLYVRVARLGARNVHLRAEDPTESVKLDAVRRDFIANISHELKTPIGAVSLLAEALQAAAKEPEQVKRFAKRLTKESDRLGRITQEIIELSRLQAADALARPETVEIDHVIAAAIDQNRVAAEARNMTMASGGDAGAEVFGDEALLVVAVHNLINNAIIYSPKGSRVGIGVSNSNGIVEIAVTDQGIGITAEEQERVFERFYRIDPARSRHTGGSGLGLSIVKHVAQNHGGDVRVWSQPGYGSTFTIRLPEASYTTADSLGESA